MDQQKDQEKKDLPSVKSSPSVLFDLLSRKSVLNEVMSRKVVQITNQEEHREKKEAMTDLYLRYLH